MVRWTRSARVAPGKDQQAIEWAKELTDWANKKYGSHLSVYMDRFGEVGTLRWFPVQTRQSSALQSAGMTGTRR
jgi:hypothetical protein